MRWCWVVRWTGEGGRGECWNWCRSLAAARSDDSAIRGKTSTEGVAEPTTGGIGESAETRTSSRIASMSLGNPLSFSTTVEPK